MEPKKCMARGHCTKVDAAEFLTLYLNCVVSGLPAVVG